MATPKNMDQERTNTLNPEETAELLQEPEQSTLASNIYENHSRDLEFLYDVPPPDLS